MTDEQREQVVDEEPEKLSGDGAAPREEHPDQSLALYRIAFKQTTRTDSPIDKVDVSVGVDPRVCPLFGRTRRCALDQSHVTFLNAKWYHMIGRPEVDIRKPGGSVFSAAGLKNLRELVL